MALRERRREQALSQEFLDRLKAYYDVQGREGVTEGIRSVIPEVEAVMREVVEAALKAVNDEEAGQKRAAAEQAYQEREARQMRATVDRAMHEYRAGIPICLPSGDPAWPLIREAIHSESEGEEDSGRTST